MDVDLFYLLFHIMFVYIHWPVIYAMSRDFRLGGKNELSPCSADINLAFYVGRWLYFEIKIILLERCFKTTLLGMVFISIHVRFHIEIHWNISRTKFSSFLHERKNVAADRSRALRCEWPSSRDAPFWAPWVSYKRRRELCHFIRGVTADGIRAPM